MNVDPRRKIVSSLLLESKGSWGSGIIGTTLQAGKLKDSAARWGLDAVGPSQKATPLLIDYSHESVSRAPFHRLLVNTPWSLSMAVCFASFQSWRESLIRYSC